MSHSGFHPNSPVLGGPLSPGTSEGVVPLALFSGFESAEQAGDTGAFQSDKAKFYISMALTDKEHIIVTKRPFIGSSKDVNNIVEEITIKNIKKLFNE